MEDLHPLFDNVHPDWMDGPDYWEEGLTMRAYVADFETTTDVEDCRVWCWSIIGVPTKSTVGSKDMGPFHGTDVASFVTWCHDNANCQLYFHNLAFDGAFLMDWLERHGWKWVPFGKKAFMTYTTLINDMNQVYSITLNFGAYAKVRIYDSLKIVPLSVAQMAKAYGLPIAKGEIDYRMHRPIGYIPTVEEWEYVDTDVRIVSEVMAEFLDHGLSMMTAGSNALNDFIERFGGQRSFRKVFPVITREQDRFIRYAYKGGYTYANPLYAGREVGPGIVLDVNSLYPSVMHDCSIPVGKPIPFDGCYDERNRGLYPLWVAAITMKCRLKSNHLPCLQIKNNSRFVATEYLESVDVETTITITNVDWELICNQYDVEVVEWLGGFMFAASDAQFKDYVDYWTEQKVQASLEGNVGKRQIAKLMQNSLYGKLSTRLLVRSRKPVLENDVIRYVDIEPEEREPVYLPAGVFITAYARYKTITAAQANYDRFLYADTDSLHLLGTELPEGLVIDPVRLGAWKHESTFDRGKFLRAKTYIEEFNGKLTVHVSGMPARCHEGVTFDNFDFGAVYTGKLYTHRVPGGIVLEEGEMVIRP